MAAKSMLKFILTRSLLWMFICHNENNSKLEKKKSIVYNFVCLAIILNFKILLINVLTRSFLVVFICSSKRT